MPTERSSETRESGKRRAGVRVLVATCHLANSLRTDVTPPLRTWTTSPRGSVAANGRGSVYLGRVTITRGFAL